jgi:heme-degrading monooxygenase HmoA
MFAVIFQVRPKPERLDDYLDLAKVLKPEIEKIDGFIDNERFKSQQRDGWILSVSTWRDEKSVVRWRTHGGHHGIQEKGRFEIFEDYHLQVGEITADTRLPPGQRLVEQRFDETNTAAAKACTMTELRPATGDRAVADDLGVPHGAGEGLVDQDVFESIYVPGKLLLLLAWRDRIAAKQWQPRTVAGGEQRHRHVRVIRDYGMFDRREAPQFYPEVRASSGPSSALVAS